MMMRWIVVLLVLLVLPACKPDTSVSVGDKAPAIKTKTLADVDGDLSRITTYRYPDERMYQYSLDQAMKTGKPIVLEFATPGHCTVCDQQLNMLKAIMQKYQSDYVFLHMDQYQNPEAFRAFKVLGDPWTFIIDRNRVVQFKRPGRVLYGELDMELSKLLADSAS